MPFPMPDLYKLIEQARSQLHVILLVQALVLAQVNKQIQADRGLIPCELLLLNPELLNLSRSGVLYSYL